MNGLLVPRVATIVLNWNGWSDTIECLQSLLAVAYPEQRIVVCDNASQDESVERIRAWCVDKEITFAIADASADDGVPNDDVRVTIVQTGANLGYGGGNNVGLRYAIDHLGAEFCWILNNDTVVERESLAAMVRLAESDPHIAVVGSRLMRYDAPGHIQALGGGHLVPFLARDTQLARGRTTHPSRDRVIELQHVIGASMLVRVAAMHDAGMLDESYFLYREETDWCLRMRGRGWRCVYCPDSVVHHKEGRSTGFKSEIHDYYSVRNMLFLIQRHYPQALASGLLSSLLYCVLPKLVRLQFTRARITFVAHLDFVRGLDGKRISPEALYTLTHASDHRSVAESPTAVRALIAD